MRGALFGGAAAECDKTLLSRSTLFAPRTLRSLSTENTRAALEHTEASAALREGVSAGACGRSAVRRAHLAILSAARLKRGANAWRNCGRAGRVSAPR